MNRLSINRPKRGLRRHSSGFTLIEVLLVLVILVILGSIAVPMFSGVGERANNQAAQVQVDLLENAINTYHAMSLQYPNSLDDLINQPSDPKAAAKWAGPYLPANKSLNDPWDNPYKYNAKGTKSGAGFDVWSMGPDGQDGSDDDIGNWAK
jgi:general secretion pathway protein G